MIKSYAKLESLIWQITPATKTNGKIFAVGWLDSTVFAINQAYYMKWWTDNKSEGLLQMKGSTNSYVKNDFFNTKTFWFMIMYEIKLMHLKAKTQTKCWVGYSCSYPL